MNTPPNTQFTIPSLFLIPEPFRYGDGCHALLPPFVGGKCKFECVGKKFTLLRTTSIDSDNVFIYHELMLNGREVDISALIGHFIDDDDGEMLDNWIRLPYRIEKDNAEWVQQMDPVEQHAALTEMVHKLVVMYTMHPHKQSVLKKYELA